MPYEVAPHVAPLAATRPAPIAAPGHLRRPLRDEAVQPVEQLLLHLASASLQSDLAAIATDGPARATHEFTGETARALHQLVETALDGGHIEVTTVLRRAQRMAHWLADRATADPSAAGARRIVDETCAVLQAVLAGSAGS